MTLIKRGRTSLNLTSTHVRESGTFLLLESGILGFGIQNTAQGTRNPTNDWNQEYSLHCQRLESSVCNLESAAWNPESKTYFLDSPAWGDRPVCIQ